MSKFVARPKRPPAILLTVYPGVAPDVAAAVGKALGVYPLVSAVRHRLAVFVVPAPAVQSPAGDGFGCCRVPGSSPGAFRGTVQVYVAGQFVDTYHSS